MNTKSLQPRSPAPSLGVCVALLVGCPGADKAVSPADGDSGAPPFDPAGLVAELVTWRAMDAATTGGTAWLIGVNADETRSLEVAVDLEPEQVPSVGPAATYPFTVHGLAEPYETRATVAVRIGRALGWVGCEEDPLAEVQRVWIGQSGAVTLEVVGDGSASVSLESVELAELGSREGAMIDALGSSEVLSEACAPEG